VHIECSCSVISRLFFYFMAGKIRCTPVNEAADCSAPITAVMAEQDWICYVPEFSTAYDHRAEKFLLRFQQQFFEWWHPHH
jgi:hypothetical protein